MLVRDELSLHKELAILNHNHVERMLQTFKPANGKMKGTISKSIVQEVWETRLTPRFYSVLVDVVFPQDSKEVSFLSFYTMYKNLAEVETEVMFRALTIYHIATFHEPPFNYEIANEYPRASFKNIKDYVCDVITSYLQALININVKEVLAWLDLKATNSSIDGNLVAAYMLKNVRSQQNEISIDILEMWLQKNEMYFTVSEQLYLYLFGINKSVDVKSLIPFPVCLTGPGSTTLLALPDILLLNSTFPRRAPLWKLSFLWNHFNNTDWSSLKQAVNGKSRTLFVIQDSNGDIFGMYASNRWFPTNAFYGNNESFLFTLKPNVNVYSSIGKSKNYQLFTESGIGMGGTEENPGLFIDWSRKVGKTTSKCHTYDNFCPLSRDLLFDIRILEMWVVNEIFTKKSPVPSRDFYSTTVMWSKFHRNKNNKMDCGQVNEGMCCNCDTRPRNDDLRERRPLIEPPHIAMLEDTRLEQNSSIMTIQPSNHNMMPAENVFELIPSNTEVQTHPERQNYPTVGEVAPVQHVWSQIDTRDPQHLPEQQNNMRQIGLGTSVTNPPQPSTTIQQVSHTPSSKQTPPLRGNAGTARNCFCKSITKTIQCESISRCKCIKMKAVCKRKSRSKSKGNKSSESEKSQKKREKSQQKEEKKLLKQEKARQKKEDKARKKEEQKRKKEEKKRAKSVKTSGKQSKEKILCSCCKCQIICKEEPLVQCEPPSHSYSGSSIQLKGKWRRKKKSRSKSKGNKNKNDGNCSNDGPKCLCNMPSTSTDQFFCTKPNEDCQTNTPAEILLSSKKSRATKSKTAQRKNRVTREICSCNCKQKSMCLVEKAAGEPCTTGQSYQQPNVLSVKDADCLPFAQLPTCFSSQGNLVITLSKNKGQRGDKRRYTKRTIPPCVLYLDCTKVRDMCVYVQD